MTMKSKNLKKSSFLFIVLAMPLWARQIHVPADTETIQSAVRQAQKGDTVVVAPGRYVENIRIRSQSICLASSFILDQDPRWILETVIDGSRPADSDSGSVVFADSCAYVQITGFTMTGGTGTVWQDVELGHEYREGGGVFLTHSTAVLSHNYLIGNMAADTAAVMSAGGGGLACEHSELMLSNTVIKYNQARYGAGIVLGFSDGEIVNSVIAENSGGQDFGGGGLWIYKVWDVNLINNTIVNNHAMDEGKHFEYGAGQGGALVLWSGHVMLTNNIIWDNTQTSAAMPVYFQAGTQVEYSNNNIQDHYAVDPLVQNISVDPEFQDSTYILAVNSPCIDAGHPGNIHYEPSASGMAIYPSRGTKVSDLGAYGGPGRTDLLGVAQDTGVPQTVGISGFELFPNFPNPFNPVTTLTFTLSEKGPVTLTVFDVKGRQTAVLIDENRDAGLHQIEFNGQGLASGVYIARLEQNNLIQNQMMLLLQ